jgi:hypothetical protein
MDLRIKLLRVPNLVGIARRNRVVLITLATVLLLGSSSPLSSENSNGGARTVIGVGWHPWYEVKVDPENADAVIVCGTKWDAERNAALGFVYVSSDGGRSWRAVLEDRNSTWVTEQSCVFGSHHRAYFLSSASKVVDETTHHELGTTRLFVSTDSGQHWKETSRTGWADWSTSAFSSSSDRLYSFFNSNATIQDAKNWGSNLGLLVFAPDGGRVLGPFFNKRMQDLNYRGIYPSNATALRSGAVVALFQALLPGGDVEDLGLVRVAASPDPSLEFSVIARTTVSKDCPLLDKGSLAYDSEHNRLFVLYGDGCKHRQPRLTSSRDEGRTWDAPVDVVAPGSAPAVVDPSLAVAPGGKLGLLWQDGRGSGRWLFSYLREGNSLGEPIVLSTGIDRLVVGKDTLTTWIGQPDEHYGSNPNTPADSSASLIMYGMFNNVWRSSGLSLVGDKLLAVWPSGTADGMRLYSAILGSPGDVSGPTTEHQLTGRADVTEQALLLYGGAQSFDREQKTLKLCLRLGNRGSQPLKTPIELKAVHLQSTLGPIYALNTTNGETGSGAIWDVSQAITGNQIPPRSTSNPFCLAFRVQTQDFKIPPQAATDLLTLKMRVFAATDSSPRVSPQN